MLPTFTGDVRVRLVAGFDPRPEARAAFALELGGTAHESVEAVCADPLVEWVYVATPHQLHADHVVLAARKGKHVLVEKPMATSLADCDRMIDACSSSGTHLIVGHSHSFNAPVRLARALIDSGRIGAVRFVHAMQYTDFLYRPRRPEELDTLLGGGVVFSQAAHQMDIVRLLAGGMAHSVRALTGRWDSARPTEGAYSALITFDDGAFASATYNGYGFYDTDALMNGVGELGAPKAANAHAQTRARLAQTTDEVAEAELKAQRNFGGRLYQTVAPVAPEACQHFGPVIVSGERGDLRLTPTGVEIHDAQGVHTEACALPAVPRAEVIDELWSVAREGQAARHGGRWSRATLELCLALLASQRAGTDIMLRQQVPVV
jgi:phthalate 4,5-cis-dihydrodiol dehydrogenase|nr:Gfo/Idh/MocA family oxidoreductase [Hydrogenophaga intermedia]